MERIHAIEKDIQPSYNEIYEHTLIANIQPPINEESIEGLKDLITEELHRHKELDTVVLGLTRVINADKEDLLCLSKACREFRLLGARVGIYGVSPGIAVLITKSNIDLRIDAAGSDLHDIIQRLKE